MSKEFFFKNILVGNRQLGSANEKFKENIIHWLAKEAKPVTNLILTNSINGTYLGNKNNGSLQLKLKNS